ncbi:ankyrin-2b isoform X1 [Acanthopagrus latus]|uniref:ankyrin-2b isoform X1 n=1 Tax=Acanthopagrus latus TaxID=8177 RepID=UPI00187C18FA|nr:ankyrin-2b isoform X1 [Acanthopagrus latus]
MLDTQISPPPCPTVEPCDDKGPVDCEGAEGGEGWSLECLQTIHTEDSAHYLSPSPWRDSFNSSRTGVCESRPLSMTDFGDSLIECDHAEQDFKKLSMELLESSEVSEKISFIQQPTTSEQRLQPAELTSDAMTESTQAKQMDRRHLDEVSHRLYKVLYGYDVDPIDSDGDNVSVVPGDIVPAEVKEDDVEGAASQTNIDEHVLNPILDSVADHASISDDLDLKSTDAINQTQDTTTQALAGPSDMNCTKPDLMSSDSFIQVLHDSVCEQTDAHSVNNALSVIPGAECSFEKPLSSTRNEPENEVVDSAKFTQDIEASCPSLFYDGSSSPECVTNAAILLTESRASSPESASSLNELNFLAPDSPVPQFRPLSPLPPAVFPWENVDVEPSARGQQGGTYMLLTAEAEERPLTPMVSNKRPFGKPVSLGSDYSDEGSISPQSLTFDLEDRALSPESIILEAIPWFFTSSERLTPSPDFHETRPSSPESFGSITAHCQLPPDSPVPEFRPVSEICTTWQSRLSSPESVSSNSDFETPLLLSTLFKDRPSSPESVASVNKYKALSIDSPIPEFGHNRPDSAVVMIGERSTSPESVSSVEEYGSSLNHEDRASSPPSVASGDESESVLPVAGHTSPFPESVESAEVEWDSIPDDYRINSPEPLDPDTQRKPSKPVESVSESEDDWVVLLLSDIEERPLSPVPDYSPMSPQSAEVDITAPFPESETLNECLSPDSPLPQYKPSVHDAVTLKCHASSPESELSDTEYEAMPLLSYFENRPLSPDSSGSKPTGAAVFVEECTEKQFETETNIHLEESKTEEKNLLKFDESEDSKTQSVVFDEIQSDKTIVTPPSRAEVLSTNSVMEVLSHDEGNNPVSKKKKSVRKKKSKKLITTDYEPVQDVTQHKRKSPKPFNKTHEEILESDQTLSPILPPETASDAPSLAVTANVPEDQHLFREHWKLISQICDPQYLGESFMGKKGGFQCAVTEIESYQSEADVTFENVPVVEKASFQSGGYERSLSPDSEAEYRPMSPHSLLVLDSLRQESFHSGDSVDSQRALSPDSPIPQYLASSSGPTHIYCRSVSTESVLSDLEADFNIPFVFEDRPASCDSVSSASCALSPESPIADFRPFLPDSVVMTGLDRSSSVESITSDLECDYFPLPLLFAENRPSSPDSISENGPLSTESPIPVFKQTCLESNVCTALERSASPVSVCSDKEYGSISLSQLSSDRRPSSPNSVVSGDDYRGDSPIPDFQPGLTESVPFVAHRSSSPESVISDVESTHSSIDISICQHRPDSPESQIPETTERQLGCIGPTSSLKAVSVPVYRLVYDAELWKLISQIRDPHYVGETFCSKTGVFEYAGTRIEYVPEDSDVKEGDLEDGVKIDIEESSDADGLQPMQTKAEGEQRPVSPDFGSSKDSSPVINSESVVTMFQERQSAANATFTVNQLMCKLYDPFYVGEAFVSRTEEFDYVEYSKEYGPLDSGEEKTGRPMSPESEAEYSPDSPVPDFKTELQNSLALVGGYRSSSPGSDTSDLEDSSRCFPSDFDIQDRPDSPHSVTSEINKRRLSPESIPEYRPSSSQSMMIATGFRTSSPDSTTSVNELTTLAADSPVPQFRQHVESAVLISESGTSSPLSVMSDTDMYVLDTPFIDVQGRSFTPDSENELRALSLDSPIPEFRQAVLDPAISNAEYRSTSPESVVYSDIDYDDDPFALAFDDHRPPSPDSVSSKRQSMSPDSPIPQYITRVSERFPSFVEFKPASPQTGTLGVERAPLMNFPPDTEDRPNSPESLELEVVERLLSPDSEAEYKCFSPTSLLSMSNFRSYSPESTSSLNKFRALSPDSPIPDFSQALQEALQKYMECRSSSPESVLSDLEVEMELPFSMLLENRPSSADSLASVSKYRRLSPDSPILQFRPALPVPPATIESYRSSSPESVTSDEELAPLLSQPFEIEGSANSPELFYEYQCLSPDSPVPQYTYTEHPVFTVMYRSASPWSVHSDEDLETDLCVPWLLEERAASPGSAASKDEFRRLSPDSPIPDFTMGLCESQGSHADLRYTSPESALSDLDMEIESSFPVIIEDRPSSPESIASLNIYRRLSPDSPVSDFRQSFQETYPEFRANRASSPESEASEIEYAPFISQMSDFEDRAESYQSGLSDSDLRGLSPDSPVPQYTMIASTMSGVRYRSTSPESVFSDEDLDTDVCIPWLFEDRAASPGSAASKDEFRPLSPDSPIPEFTMALCESTVSHMDFRSTSPESASSDLDMEIESPFPVIIEDRPSSPESLASLNKYGRLSPDSPVSDFRQASLETYLEFNAYRSSSPESESTCSDIEYIVTSLGTLDYQKRNSSPGSGESGDEYQALSPDSPIPEFTQSRPEFPISHMDLRSTSPESVLSDLDMDIESSFPVITEDRPSSPESLASLNKYRRLSPDSPVSDFRQSFQETYPTFRANRASSPESEASEIEYAPFISQMSDFEDRAESHQSGLSDSDLRGLSPDSPVPQYTMIASTMSGVRYRSTSPESVFSDEDLDTDVCVPWLFEDRAASPGLAASDDEFRRLSPDSPIPEFTLALCESYISHADLRSNSPESVLSDLDMEIELSFPLTIENRNSSPESLASLNKYQRLSPDSPVSDFRQASLETYLEFNAYRSSSPESESTCSDIEYIVMSLGTLDYQKRNSSPGSGESGDEYQALSPDSPIPEFTQSRPEFPISHMDLRSTSPESVLSDLDMDIESSFPVITEDRPSSPESLASLNKYRRLSPDSPVSDFRQSFQETYPEFRANRASSPESEASEIEYAPFISQMSNFEDRAESHQSGLSDSDLRGLSPDSPVPQYTMIASTMSGVRYRSTSPESVFSDEDLDTDVCVPWLFEERAASPGSAASDDEFRRLSPDSPIPEFTLALCESYISHADLRSNSPESVLSDLDMEIELSFPMTIENRNSSPESLASLNKYRRLSPDSPVSDFRQASLETYLEFNAYRSSSPESESTCSDIEYIVTSLGTLVYAKRNPSPGSEESGDEYQALSADSPIPEFTAAVPESVIVNACFRSSSSESTESEIEYALSELLMSMNSGVEDRPVSPESAGSEVQERPLSVESVPEYKPFSPNELMLLGNIRSVSPESTQSFDEHKRLSPDSPLPWFTQNVDVTMTAGTHVGCSSPESVLSYTECGLALYDEDVIDRPLSPQSEKSDDEFKPLATIQTLGQLCTEETGVSPASVESCMEEFLGVSKSLVPGINVQISNEATIDSAASSTAMAPTSLGESVIMVAEYNLVEDAELWKLISQVRDPLYAGETYSRKTGFMQFVGSTFETSVPDDDQDTIAKYENLQDSSATAPPSEVTHPVSTKDTASTDDGILCTSSAQVVSNIRVLESPPPMIEQILSSGAAPYRHAQYTFEVPATEAQATVSDYDRMVVSVSDRKDKDERYSPESWTDSGPMSPDVAMVLETRASSPDSVTSVNELRPLSPDSPLPEFTVALPECITFLRSVSSSPESVASDYISFANVESQFVECRPSSPESALSEDRNLIDRSLSSESQPEYRPMSLESAMHMADKRASSPESLPEFNENRPLSPDSPIPEFTVSWKEYTNMHRSSSLESLVSDSECELEVTSSSAAEYDRPSSPESVNEVRRLLPDSPVPEFMRILSSYFLDATNMDRSSSPVSLSSDSEFVALPIDCWIDDSPRPLSPQSAESEEELGFCYERTDRYVCKPKLMSHVTSPLLPDLSSPLPNKRPLAASPLLVKTAKTKPEEQNTTGLKSEVLSYNEWMQHESEAEGNSTTQTTVCEEKGLPVKPSLVQDSRKKTLHISPGELKSKTASERALPQTPEETHFHTDDEMQRKLSTATTMTQDTTKVDFLFATMKATKSVPLQLPDQSLYTTHRTVTPVLPEKTSCPNSERSYGYSDLEFSPKKAQISELFSPMSTQFLVPPDYEAVFSGHQTLKVSECSQASLNDLSPVSPVFSDSISAQAVKEANTKRESENPEDFEFSPDFDQILSEFEKTVSELESEDPKDLSKRSESLEHSDSDLEFFDCRQAISEFSEPEELKLEHEITYHISEPPSPMPGSSPDVGFLKESLLYTDQPYLRVNDSKRFSSGSESLGEFAYDSEGSRECQTEGDAPVCEELPSRDQAGYYDDDDFLGREIAEELGVLSSDSSEEEVLTTRVVRRRVIIQADDLPDIPSQTVTEEKYTDEHGNIVVKKITRKVIRKYVSPDGMETQEVTIEGSHQETVQIEEGDAVSRVVKRTVLRSEGDQKELTFSEPLALGAATSSEFEVEPVQGRKVSKVVKTTVVRGERMEKQMGDPSLAADLPSAREDFEKALSYTGGFGKMLVPHVVEKEVVQDDGSVVKRSHMRKSRTQKRTVMRDAQGKHVHLERLDDTPDALQPDALQQHLHQLLRRYCEDDREEEGEDGDEEEEGGDIDESFD